jgi:large subunit ribosomal protein L6e
LLAKGVPKFSRTQTFHKNGQWAIKARGPQKKAADKAAQPKTVPMGKGTRVIKAKEPRYYPTEDVRLPISSRKTHHRPASLRSNITPGTVLIMVAGRFRGHRVVFLKRLESGLLLVTGPFKVNGVPLRRVNQAYVIATSTKLDIATVKVPEHINDTYFRKTKEAKAQKSEADFLNEKKEKKELPAARKADQKTVDSQLLPLVKKTPLLAGYLSSRFSLKKKQFPHELKF